MSRRLLAVIAAVVYLTSVVLANWLTTRYGFVNVGFSQQATAGTFAIGGALVVRDVLQDAVGRAGVFALILLAAGVSYLVAAHAIALASFTAFCVSELLDMLAYTPLRRHSRFGDLRWQSAVTAGAVVGAVVDTAIFLGIAFGAAQILPALPGQLLGKGEVAAVLIAAGVVSRALFREPLDSRGA